MFRRFRKSKTKTPNASELPPSPPNETTDSNPDTPPSVASAAPLQPPLDNTKDRDNAVGESSDKDPSVEGSARSDRSRPTDTTPSAADAPVAAPTTRRSRSESDSDQDSKQDGKQESIERSPRVQISVTPNMDRLDESHEEKVDFIAGKKPTGRGRRRGSLVGGANKLAGSAAQLGGHGIAPQHSSDLRAEEPGPVEEEKKQDGDSPGGSPRSVTAASPAAAGAKQPAGSPTRRSSAGGGSPMARTSDSSSPMSRRRRRSSRSPLFRQSMSPSRRRKSSTSSALSGIAAAARESIAGSEVAAVCSPDISGAVDATSTQSPSAQTDVAARSRQPLEALAAKTGLVRCVAGDVEVKDVGQTLIQEHVLVNYARNFCAPSGGSKRAAVGKLNDVERRDMWNAPMSAEVASHCRGYFNANKDNLSLDDLSNMESELKRFRELGGSTIVDCAVPGIGRDAAGLLRLSRATTLNIVMGTGFYLSRVHPDKVKRFTIEQLAETFVSEISIGVKVIDGDKVSRVRAGFIGEIGCTTVLQAAEIRVLKAAAAAQRRTGAMISVYPGYSRESPFEIARVLESAGAELRRVVMGHMDRGILGIDDMARLAESGLALGFTNFGLSDSFTHALAYGVEFPSDFQRAKIVQALIERGFLENIVISHNLSHKSRLARFGGSSYDHILRSVVPYFLRIGVTATQVRQVLVDTPSRLLQLVEPLPALLVPRLATHPALSDTDQAAVAKLHVSSDADTAIDTQLKPPVEAPEHDSTDRASVLAGGAGDTTRSRMSTANAPEAAEGTRTPVVKTAEGKDRRSSQKHASVVAEAPPAEKDAGAAAVEPGSEAPPASPDVVK